ncbi:MAG: hypothetical protein AB1941_09175 [Gemmatimonadota bacterium]
MNLIFKRTLRTTFTVLLVFAAGCDSVVGSLIPVYDGPTPVRDDISSETVIIRKIDAQPGTGIQFFLVDRERYLSSAPQNINRVVEVMSRDIQPTVTAMQLRVGERVRVSTRFVSFSMAGDLGGYFPNWQYDRYDEYPIGFHNLTSVERVAP